MKFIIAILWVFAIAAIPAMSQTPSPERHAAALKLFEVLNWRGVMEEARTEAVVQTKNHLRTILQEELGSPTPEEYSEVEGIVDQFLWRYSLNATIADLIAVFETRFSTAEIEELATFFSTPVYRRFQSEMVAMYREASDNLKHKMQPEIQETVNRVLDRIAEMKNARTNK